MELREEAGDSAEDFVKAVQEDILSDKIYVFTQMVKSKNYQEVQVLLTLLMLSIQKLVTMRLERK